MAIGSQYGEDRWIADNLPLPERGEFVEVGAADGLENSNTLYFEQRGWTGVVVEPDPRHHGRLMAHRKCRVWLSAVGSQPGIVPFPQHADPTWSGFLRADCPTVDVQCVTLADVVRQHELDAVDLLSIDTEGTELDVWASRPAGWNPAIVIIEHDTAGLPSTREAILAQLTSDGYRLVHETPCNLIFTSKGD